MLRSRDIAAAIVGLAAALATAPALAEDASPEQAVSALWRAMSHAPGAAADVATLRMLFHSDAVVFGSRIREQRPSLRRSEIEDFLTRLEPLSHVGFHECEIARRVESHDRFATVYSVVESRTHASAPAPDFVGVNSLQLYRDDEGWKIVSLYYHVAVNADAIAHDGASGACLP